MSNQNKTKTKTDSSQTKKKKDSNHVITLRSETLPAVQASIFRRITGGGDGELYFEIKRAFTRDDGKTFQYTAKWYPRHLAALNEVGELAVEWIAQHPEAADGPLPPSDDGQQRFAAAAPGHPQ